MTYIRLYLQLLNDIHQAVPTAAATTYIRLYLKLLNDIHQVEQVNSVNIHDVIK